MYKIFINDIPVSLQNTEDLKLTDIKHSSSMICKYNGNVKQLRYLIDLVESGLFVTSMVIHSSDLIALKKDFKSMYLVIEAAGGMIMNEENECLFIFRRGHWDLPKGKIDKGETRKVAAVREVMEETGVKDVVISDKITVSYHTFKNKIGTRILKKTHWYFMHTHMQKLKPQKEEDITKALWMTLEDFEKCKPVYGNILQTVDAFHHIVASGKEVEIDHLI